MSREQLNLIIAREIEKQIIIAEACESPLKKAIRSQLLREAHERETGTVYIGYDDPISNIIDEYYERELGCSLWDLQLMAETSRKINLEMEAEFNRIMELHGREEHRLLAESK